MIQFPPKKKRTESEPAEDTGVSGSTFLKEARGRLSEIIGQYAVEEKQADYDSIEDLLSALEEDVWPEAEKLLKESFRNGRGGRGKGR